LKTPSLFDEPDPVPVVVEQSSDDDTGDDDEWHEVPQAVFLSWSDARQWDHCWRRDLHAATHADDTYWQRFFLDRAAAYKTLRDDAIHHQTANHTT
jgi:hypothetical protein